MKDPVADPVNIFLCQIRINWKAENALGDMLRDRRRRRVKAGAASVTVERIGQGIKILPGDDIFRRKQIEYFVTRITLAVKHDREIRII